MRRCLPGSEVVAAGAHDVADLGLRCRDGGVGDVAGGVDLLAGKPAGQPRGTDPADRGRGLVAGQQYGSATAVSEVEPPAPAQEGTRTADSTSRSRFTIRTLQWLEPVGTEVLAVAFGSVAGPVRLVSAQLGSSRLARLGGQRSCGAAGQLGHRERRPAAVRFAETGTAHCQWTE